MSRVTISKENSIALSYIRIISVFLIILCHIFQGLDNELAWWFNVGVQIFLFMSGFLIAKNKITNTKDFLIKRFKRVLKPYYIALALIFILYLGIGQEIKLINVFTYIFVLQGITYKNTIPGMGHLWFVSVILMCYILTVLLNKFRKSMKIDSNKKFYMFLFGILLLTQIAVNLVYDNLNILKGYYGAWIGAYIVGYFISTRYDANIDDNFFRGVTILTLILIPLRIYIRYFRGIENPVINSFFNKYYVNWTHVLLGIFIFCLIFKVVSSVARVIYTKNKYIKKITTIRKILDKASYETYLMHQVFILGPASLLFFSNNLALNIVFIFMAIIIGTYLVVVIEDIIKNKVYLPSNIRKNFFIV